MSDTGQGKSDLYLNNLRNHEQHICNRREQQGTLALYTRTTDHINDRKRGDVA